MAVERFFAHVDGGDIRQARAREAFGQRQPPVAFAPDIIDRFQRRRRGCKDDGEITDMATHHGHIAGVVDHTFILLEAGVVLFIDHDQTKIAIGQHQRRPCTDDQLGLTVQYGTPVAPPLGHRQIGMPDHGTDPEASFEPPEPVGGKGNFRQQHDDLPVRPDGCGDGFEIDLGLARSGYPVEQSDRIPCPNVCRQRGRRRRLRLRQHSARKVRVG